MMLFTEAKLQRLRWLALAGLLAAGHSTPKSTPDNSSKVLAAAGAALQTQDFRGALRILEPAMTDLGKNSVAWRVIGVAHLKLHESAAADEALREALTLDPKNPIVLMSLGINAAQAGRTDDAFEWLHKAKATRRIDMTQLEVDADVKALRNDPRYSDLLPTAEDFARPFVEPVNIIREWDGEASGDQFGWIARVIGDVDGDGVNDFVTSAPTKDIGGENAGRIYVYSGRTGEILWKVDGSPGDQLGTGIEAAGDINKDGVPDVIGGAPGIDAVYIYSGRDGHVLLTLHGEEKGDNFGIHVASVGDVDGDGSSDIIVGAPGNNAGGKGAGRAYVYSGKDGHLLLMLTGEHAGDALGSTVGGYSDAHHHFLLVGAPAAGPHRSGRVYVYRDLSQRPAFVFDADPAGVALGYMFLSVLGDVDGDGVPDVFASDWSDASRGPGTGKAYVYSGRTGRRLYTFTGETAGEGFGTTASVAGDVTGDGRADMIIGSWQYSREAQGAGRAYLYDGRSGKLLRTYTSRVPGDTFGFDAVGMGTRDGNGQSELLITAGWSGVHGYHSGRIFLISSGIPPVH